MADDDLELLIDDPSDVKVEPKSGETAKAPAVDDGIQALKAQLAQKDAQLGQATRAAQEANAREQEASRYVGQTQHQALTGALTARQERLAMLKEDFKNAAAIGDAERMADLQEALTDVKLDIRQIEEGKRVVEARLQNPPRRADPEPDDGMTAPTRAWLANHQDAVTDERKYNAMLAGHHDAIARGIPADTPEYFQHVEARIYGTKPTETAERGRVADAEDGPAKPMARYAAPVERDAGPRKVQLRITPQMREAAEISGMTIEEYAKQYVAVHGVS